MMQDMIKGKVKRMLDRPDPARDFHHIKHVYKNAKMVDQREGASMEINRKRSKKPG